MTTRLHRSPLTLRLTQCPEQNKPPTNLAENSRHVLSSFMPDGGVT
jgi:hypothetical protein